jgi:hypothetical protein
MSDTTPPPLPPDYIDLEHQGQDRELLEAFYGACKAEGGTSDEIHLRGIRAVLARRPTVAAVRAADAGQVEPGPFSEHDLREQWNAQADEFNQWESLDSSEQLAWAQTRAIHDVIIAAITRWPAPVAQPAAQPVNLAELHDPDFSGGLTPSQHLDVLHGGPDPRTAATASPGLPPRVGHILRLAAIIRKVDGKHDLGAAALAEAILAHPGFSDCHDGPVASAAQGEVAELVAALEADAECVAAEHYDLCNMTADQMRRIAQLLKASTQPADADRGQP